MTENTDVDALIERAKRLELRAAPEQASKARGIVEALTRYGFDVLTEEERELLNRVVDAG
jgi:hypothetical protein